MKQDRPDKPNQDNPYSRIEELEDQVQELTSLVERMIGDRPPAEAEDAPTPEPLEEQLELGIAQGEHEPRETMLETIAQRVGQALGGEEGETLEARIGGIWLVRIAAMLTMTVVALGFAMTFRDEALSATPKIGIGYGLAAFGIIAGLVSRKKSDVFPQTLLGCGLAALYFTTYAACFIEPTRVVPDPRLGFAAVAAAFTTIIATIHFRRSQGAAGITLFLIFYTVVLSMRGNPDLTHVLYAFGTCAMLGAAALLFHLRHRWLSFTWGALVATHLTYLFFFKAKPPTLELSDVGYFWLSNGFLTFIYVLFSMACVTDARRTGEYRRTVGPMSGVNSFVFLTLTWFSIREHYPEEEWIFRLAFCVMMIVFAVYAHYTGPRLNYLFQIFVAKAFIMFTLSMQAYLSHEWLLVALALECLGLAFSYQRAGLVIFKLMGLGLLAITFVGALVSVRIPGEVDVFGWTVPANWFVCVAAPVVLTLVAAFYEHFVRRVPPEKRIVRGQWFLADSMWDIRSAAMAMIHASAAALILMVITIIDMGGSPYLPYILAGQSVALVVWGLILRTPQIDVAGVLLLGASHVTFHTFLGMDREGFVLDGQRTLYTCGIALLTYVGGFLWERYLSRIQGGSRMEHDLLSAIPYLAATFLLISVANTKLDPQYAAVALNGVGVLLMLVSGVARLTGIRASSILVFGIGTAIFYRAMYTFEHPLAAAPHFFTTLALLLTTFALAERLVLLWGRGDHEAHDLTPDFARSILVGIAATLGVMGLWEWAPADQLSLYLLGLFMVAMTLGVLFRESRYRWAGIIVYFIALLRAYMHDLTNLAPGYRLLTFAGLCIPLVIISWGYSRYRARSLQQIRIAREETGDSHGQEA